MHSDVKDVIHKIYYLLDEETSIVNNESEVCIMDYKLRKIDEVLQFEIKRLQHLLNKSFYEYLPSKFFIFKRKIQVELVSSTLIIILPRGNDVLQSTDTYYEHVYRPLLTYLEMLKLDTEIHFETNIVIQAKRVRTQ